MMIKYVTLWERSSVNKSFKKIRLKTIKSKKWGSLWLNMYQIKRIFSILTTTHSYSSKSLIQIFNMIQWNRIKLQGMAKRKLFFRIKILIFFRNHTIQVWCTTSVKLKPRTYINLLILINWKSNKMILIYKSIEVWIHLNTILVK